MPVQGQCGYRFLGSGMGLTRGPGAATEAFGSPWRGLGEVGCRLPAHRLCLEKFQPLWAFTIIFLGPWHLLEVA